MGSVFFCLQMLKMGDRATVKQSSYELGNFGIFFHVSTIPKKAGELNPQKATA
jgi:hypothetical protein